MGLLGSAFRVGSYAARTGIRAGTSIASGRVPSLSIGLGIGGFGARIGTRGVSIRTPVASQSIGAHGLTSTIRLPGIASLSVNPVRPSVAAGLGPVRVRASKNPGMMVGSPILSIGFSKSSLFFANVGPFTLAVPGQLTRPSRPWSEEVDDQWMPYYQRRPPAISEQLHFLITQVEDDALRARPSLIADFPIPQVPFETIPKRDVRNQKRAFRKEERANIRLFARVERRAAKFRADELLCKWQDKENTARKKTQGDRQGKVDLAYNDWKKGDHFLGMLVFQSLAHANSFSTYVIEVSSSKLLVAVFGSRIEDIHPLGPSWTPSGNPTVKKRGKKEREAIWADICSSQISIAAQIARVSFTRHRQMEALVLLPASATSFGQIPVVSHAHVNIPNRGHIDGRPPFINGLLKKPRQFSSFHPNKSFGSDDVATATSVSSVDEIYTPDFWLQAELIRQEITKSRSSVAKASKGSLPVQQKTNPVSPSIPQLDLDELIASLEEISSPSDAVARLDQIDMALSAIEAHDFTENDFAQLEYLIFELGHIAHYLDDEDLLERLIALGTTWRVSELIVIELRSFLQQMTVSEHESRLRKHLADLRAHIDNDEPNRIFELGRTFMTELPKIPDGADDEAAELASVLLEALAFLGRSDLFDELVSAASTSSEAFQTRFQPIIEWETETLRMTEAIVEFIEANPGTIQVDLASDLGLDVFRTRKICWYLDHFGVIQRQRRGRSYSLHIADDTNLPVIETSGDLTR